VAESDVNDEFEEAVIIIAGIVAKIKLNRNKSNHHFSHVHATFWFRIEQCSNRIIGAGIWYQTNPVPDLHDTCSRNRRQKNGIDLWRRFLDRVLCA